MRRGSVQVLRGAAWAALLVLLPVTSMPLVKALVRSSTVASPSILALAVLVIFWLLPYLLRRGRLPVVSIPLFAFVSAAVLSSAAAYFLAAPSFKDHQMLRQIIEAFITLGVGLSYYLVTVTWVTDRERLVFSLRWINLAGGLILLWCLAQALAWFGFGRYPDWMRAFQDQLSLGPMYRGRVTGFALEPSWLAHQLNMLYLPLWLAATLQRWTSYRRKFMGLTVENGLLVGGVLALGLSFSRVGYGAFMLVLTYLFLRYNRRLVSWLQNRLTVKTGRRPWVRGAVLLALVAVYLLAGFGVLTMFSRLDPRMENVFRTSYWRDGGFLTYANELQFGERAVYWQSGWNIFTDYPILGVGLGNAGFYFQEHLPAYAWKMVEVRRLMYRVNELPNTKNLWVRLLSETGLVGFSVFVSWLVVLWRSARYLITQHADALIKVLGMSGMFVLLGLLMEGFSIDSFALPYLWISTGLLTAGFTHFSVLNSGKNNIEAVS